MTANSNINSEMLIEPSAELNNKLNMFDSVINGTFGYEINYIKHFLWSENVSFTTVKFANGDFINFRVSSKRVIDDGYTASKEHLNKALRAFGIELPYWMHH